MTLGESFLLEAKNRVEITSRGKNPGRNEKTEARNQGKRAIRN